VNYVGQDGFMDRGVVASLVLMKQEVQICIFLCFLLPRDASAERGDATVSRLSDCLSVTFRYHELG